MEVTPAWSYDGCAYCCRNKYTCLRNTTVPSKRVISYLPIKPLQCLTCLKRDTQMWQLINSFMIFLPRTTGSCRPPYAQQPSNLVQLLSILLQQLYPLFEIVIVYIYNCKDSDMIFVNTKPSQSVEVDKVKIPSLKYHTVVSFNN